MIELLDRLSQALDGAPVAALAAAFAWGILSMLLSPCHLAAIPAIIGLVEEEPGNVARRPVRISLLFAAGILASIAVIGLITAALGRIVGDLGRFGHYIAAAIFFAVGLQLLGILPNLWHRPKQTGMPSTGYTAIFLTGLFFGIALGPCTFAFMAPVLTATFQSAAEAPAYAVALLLLYGLGNCLPIVLAGMSAGIIRRYLNWNEQSKGAKRLRSACGILILLAGLYLIYTAT